jgi:hypothetical protein
LLNAQRIRRWVLQGAAELGGAIFEAGDAQQHPELVQQA